MPVELVCEMSRMRSVSPSVAPPEKWNVEVLAKLLRLKLPPNHSVIRPVKVGTLVSGIVRSGSRYAVIVAVPVKVEVNQPSRALLMIECSTPLPVPVIAA